MNRKITSLITSFILIIISNLAWADYPRDWQMYFQEPVTEIMEQYEAFHHFLMIIITSITILVLGLMIYVSIRYNSRTNPVPNNFSHNTIIEIIWTTVPVIILAAIAIPSLKILFFANIIKDPELTVKVVGHQWYWEYIYPDNENIRFDSYIIQDKDLKPGDKRLLEVDNHLVLPVDTNIRIMGTAADVIHNFAVPAFGIKTDVIPGRVNEAWFNIKKPGIYYGQCSELCGIGHAFMPIVVEAVSKEDFATWLETAKTKFQ